MSFGVDSSATGAASELGVLPRCQVYSALTVVLIQAFKNHGSCWHVNSEGKSFSGKNYFDQFSEEQLFNDLFEGRQHSGVVRCHTSLKSGEPLVIAESCKIFVGDAVQPRLHDFPNLVLLFGGGQSNAVTLARLDALLAASSRKHEENCGQEVLIVENIDNFRLANSVYSSLVVA